MGTLNSMGVGKHSFQLYIVFFPQAHSSESVWESPYTLKKIRLYDKEISSISHAFLIIGHMLHVRDIRAFQNLNIAIWRTFRGIGNSNQEEDNRYIGGFCQPFALLPLLCMAERPQPGTLALVGHGYWAEVAISWPNSASGCCSWSPLSCSRTFFSFLHLVHGATLQIDGLSPRRWRQTPNPVFLKERINEAVESSWCLFQNGPQQRETDDCGALVGRLCCPECDLSEFVCDLCAQGCRSQAVFLPGIWLFAFVKCRSLDLLEQRVKSWSVLQERL